MLKVNTEYTLQNMKFYLKSTILARLLLFLLFYICVVSAQRRDARTYLSRAELSDLTKGLTDAEIESALSELSLSDLDALSQLIDKSNSFEYAYEDTGGGQAETTDNAKQKKSFYGLMDQEPSFGRGSDSFGRGGDSFGGIGGAGSLSNNIGSIGIGGGNEGNEEEEDVYMDEPADDTGHLPQFQMQRLTNMRGGNPRLKRENTKSGQIPVDEEYIRQLENSFPRDQEQNGQDDIGDKKEHVRVKRN